MSTYVNQGGRGGQKRPKICQRQSHICQPEGGRGVKKGRKSVNVVCERPLTAVVAYTAQLALCTCLLSQLFEFKQRRERLIKYDNKVLGKLGSYIKLAVLVWDLSYPVYLLSYLESGSDFGIVN